MSIHRLVDVWWGAVGILIAGGIYGVVVIRRMQNTVRSMSLQLDELMGTHVLMQDHLDRVARQLEEAQDSPPSKYW